MLGFSVVSYLGSWQLITSLWSTNLTYNFSDHKEKANKASNHQFSPCFCVWIDRLCFVTMNVRQIIIASIRMILVRYEWRVFFFIEVWRLVASAPYKTARMNARRSPIKNWKCIFFICIYTSHPGDSFYFDFAGNRTTRFWLNQLHSRSQSFEFRQKLWELWEPEWSKLLHNEVSCAHASAVKSMDKYEIWTRDYGEWICGLLKELKVKKSPAFHFHRTILKTTWICDF